ncbi:MAG TPA: cytochrome c oxidase assembly protein [Polyangiaceae bacterium]|jgi:cytochrome c oxidase assembly factor CtaG|nr:cytochrome c oxidase assembly protein [Polyangiaceae bacterium]
MHHPIPESWPDAVVAWTFDPYAMTSIVALSIPYAFGVRNLWHSAGIGRGIRPAQVGAFAAGMATLALALISPLDYFSDLLFSAHMAQHELLMVVSAPLIVMGRPFVAFLWALPIEERARIRAFVHAPNARAAWSFVSAPLFVLLLHGAARWLWHVPRLFEAAMKHDVLHAFQHVTFFGTAALFWWAVVHGRYGKAGYGVGFLFVFATALHTSMLGALIAFTPLVLYPIYRTRSLLVGSDAHVDQQLAGFIMWVPSGFVLGAGAVVLFALWLVESERRARRGGARNAPLGRPTV